MTDIRSALVSSPASQPANSNRSAATDGGDQDGFDQALFGDATTDGKAKDSRADNDAPRDKRWLKLAERLAAKTASEADAKPAAAQDEPVAEVEPEPLGSLVPDQPAKDAAKPEQPAETALPLILALSELRKVASKATNAEAPAEDAGGSTEAPVSRGVAIETAPSAPAAGKVTQNHGLAGAQLPEGMTAATAEDVLAKAAPTTGAPADGPAAEADKPARPAPARQLESQAQPGRVSVISEQAMPAPAASAPSATATALALDIASAAPRHTAAATAVQQLQATATNSTSAHSLKIQLRPVELGTVTANLHLAGSHLTVEIEVENTEAYHRLSADREAITSALKGLGFDVEHVTIQAPQASNSANARTDGNAPQTGSGGRDQPATQSGGTGGDSANSNNRQTSRGAAGEDTSTRNISSPGRASSGGSLYI